MKKVICLFLGGLLLIIVSCDEIYGFGEEGKETDIVDSIPAKIEDWIAEDTVYIEISPD